MHYDEFHNHKWGKNLKHARRLLAENQLEAFYHGEDLPGQDVYPGMRVMAAYWISVEHEMKLRCRKLLEGAGHLAWVSEPELLSQLDDFFGRYLADMRTLVAREEIVPVERLDNLAARGWRDSHRLGGEHARLAAGVSCRARGGRLRPGASRGLVRLLPALGGERCSAKTG